MRDFLAAVEILHSQRQCFIAPMPHYGPQKNLGRHKRGNIFCRLRLQRLFCLRQQCFVRGKFDQRRAVRGINRCEFKSSASEIDNDDREQLCSLTPECACDVPFQCLRAIPSPPDFQSMNSNILEIRVSCSDGKSSKRKRMWGKMRCLHVIKNRFIISPTRFHNDTRSYM